MMMTPKIVCDENGQVVDYVLSEEAQKALQYQPLIENVQFVEEEIFSEVLSDCADFRNMLEAMTLKSELLGKFTKDVFMLLFKSNQPKFVVTVRQSYAYLLQLLKGIMEFADYNNVKKMTTMNVANSILMTTNIMESLMSHLSVDELEALHALEKQEKEMSVLVSQYEADMEHLKNLTIPDEIRAQLHERIARTKDFMSKMDMHLTATEQVMMSVLPKLNTTVQKGIDHGTQQVKRSVQDLLSFGVGEGHLKSVQYKDILTLAEVRKKNKWFVRVLDELSRQTKFKDALKKSTAVRENNQSFNDVTSGDDISKALPSEIMEAGVAELEDCFYERFLEEELDIIDDAGEVPKQKGKFIVLKDGSGSMRYNSKDVKADATALSSIIKAKEDKRETVLITFGTRSELSAHEFPVEGLSVQDMISAASEQFGGGTDFEVPLKYATKLISSGKYKDADILMLTDGECNVSSEFIDEFRAFKKANNVKCVAVYINVGDSSYGAGTAVLEKFCDKIILLSDLMDDDELLTTIFTM